MSYNWNHGVSNLQIGFFHLAVCICAFALLDISFSFIAEEHSTAWMCGLYIHLLKDVLVTSRFGDYE